MKKGIIKIILISIIIIAISYFTLSNIFKNNTMAYYAGQTCSVCFQGTLTTTTKNCKRGLWCAYCASFYGGTTESHSFGSWTTYQSATCTTAAKTKRSCRTCGKTEYGTGQAAKGHMYSPWGISVQPTCTKVGQRTRDCSVCFYVQSEEIPKTEHIYSEKWTIIKSPTCTSEGEKVIKCVNCGGVRYKESIPKNGHMLSQWGIYKQPTCTEEGKRVRDCSVCFQEFYEDIPKIDHNSSNGWITKQEPTCATEGKKVIECTVCGEIIDEDTIPAKGHDFCDSEWEVSKQGTCQQKEISVRHCGICGFKEEKEGDYGGHNFLDWQIYIYGDCTTKRVMRRYCGNGNCEEMEEEIGKVIHPYTIEEIIRQPNCIEDGEKRITCTKCKAVETEIIKSAGSHNMQLVPDKEFPGSHYIACSVCGIKDTSTSTWNEPCQYTITNVTPLPKYCTDIVTTEYTCECGYTYTSKEPFLTGHSTSHDGGINLIKEATCSEKGYCTFYCGVELLEGVICKYEYDGQEIEINLDAHNEKWTQVKGKSKDQCVCTICKQVLMIQDCIPKAETTKHYPTCISDGYEIYHCQICDRTIGEPDFSTNMGRALGHDYQDGINCSRCSHQIEKVQSLTYEVSDTYMSNINPETSMENVMSQIITDADEVNIYKRDNTKVEGQDIMATGMRIVSTSGNRTSSLAIVVKGDTTGDGNADFFDMVLANKARLSKAKLENEFFEAADVNNDGENDIRDLVKINKFRLNKIVEL